MSIRGFVTFTPAPPPNDGLIGIICLLFIGSLVAMAVCSPKHKNEQEATNKTIPVDTLQIRFIKHNRTRVWMRTEGLMEVGCKFPSTIKIQPIVSKEMSVECIAYECRWCFCDDYRPNKVSFYVHYLNSTHENAELQFAKKDVNGGIRYSKLILIPPYNNSASQLENSY